MRLCGTAQFGCDIWCISSIYGPTDITSVSYSVIMAVFVTTLSVVTAVFLALAWREVFRQRRTVQHQTTGAKLTVSVKYVTSISIVFTSVMLIPSVITVIVGFTHGQQFSGMINWVACYLQTSYSVVNCLIYAGFSETYRKTFVRVFVSKLCWRNTTPAAPPDLRTRQQAAVQP